MGLAAKQRIARRNRFSDLMRSNKESGLKKGSGLKPKVTIGAFGRKSAHTPLFPIDWKKSLGVRKTWTPESSKHKKNKK